MNRKRVLSILLMIVLVFASLVLPATDVEAASRFKDVPSTQWAYNYVEDISNRNIINGYPDGTFRPNNSLTREQAAKIIVNAVGILYEGKVADFPDVATDSWSSPYIAAAKEAGIITGHLDGTFRPHAKVTREQIAAMVARAFDLELKGTAIKFKDVPADSWSKDSIDILASNKIVNGYPDGTFKPRNSITRAQFAKVISNVLGSGLSDVIPQKMEVHFIDVGQGDAALIIQGDHAMLIDGGKVSDSSRIYTYLKNRNIEHLDYIVNSHPHEDHVGGLAGALNYATVSKALAPVTTYDSKAFNDFVSYLGQQGVSLSVPKVGDSFALGSATIDVLGPINYSSKVNNNSLVLKVNFGDTSFLFTGDAEREEELDILNSGADINSTVLKTGHHGSDTSTSYQFLWHIMPMYAVISVGSNNGYGHPTDAVLSRFRDADVKVLRTDMQGDIIFTSDGTNVTYTVCRNLDADTLAPGDKPVTDPHPSGPYILNTNTKKFHYSSCSAVKQMSEKNKQTSYDSRASIISQGYSPCGICKP